MTQLRFVLLALNAALLVAGSRDLATNDLDEELRQRQLQEGLTIGHIEPLGRLALKRYGQYHPVYTTFTTSLDLVSFAVSGRTLAGLDPELKLRVFTVQGVEIDLVPGRLLNPRRLALSADSKHLAFCGTYALTEGGRPQQRLPGVFAAFLQTHRIVQIRAFDTEDDRYKCGELSWSPDGKHFVYEYGGDIFIVEPATAVSRLLVRGKLPSWSPDGEWIAYLDTGQNVRLISPRGSGGQLLVADRKVCGGLTWSPDGKYLAFGENALHPPYVASSLIVLRLSDGATTSVWDSWDSNIGGDYGWIYFDLSALKSATQPEK